MKEFYLMRHGQTRFNVQHRLQGVCDAPLTEVGIEQAKKAGQYLAKQEPILIMSLLQPLRELVIL